MLFKKLAGLLAGNAAITLLVSGTEAAMTVTVLPKPSKSGEETAALATPMVLQGSADELDAEFFDLLDKFSGARKSLAEQFEATAAVIEAAKKESAGKAAKTVAKTAKATDTTVKGAPPESDGDDEEPGDGDDVGGTVKAEPQSNANPPNNLFE